jgi:hypothetical protein
VIVHWYNIASVAAGVVIAVLSYVGVRSGVRRSIADARAARAQEWSDEHARWLRDKRAEVYEATIADITARSRARSDVFSAGTKSVADFVGMPSGRPAELRARLRLYGSKDAYRLAIGADDAQVQVSLEHLAWHHDARGGADDSPVKRRLLADAMRTANVADEALLDYLADEMARPVRLTAPEHGAPSTSMAT